MSDNSTKRMIKRYNQEASPTLFLSSMFQSPPENFHNSQDVEIDIVRSEEDVSIAIQDLSAGYRMNSNDIYTNKSFTPPIHKEAGAINAFDLIKRVAGDNPFEDVNFQANAISKAFDIFRKVERKIRRAMELQASQVLQTGVATLTDSTGAAVYSIDYKPKATHFPTAVTAWDAVGGLPLADINALADVIRGDGLTDVDQLIFGDDVWNIFINHATVQALLENRRIDLGAVAPANRGNGGIFKGTIWIGNYNFEMWTYQGRYTNPNGGASTKFLNRKKVIVKSSASRLDATFGAIPRMVRPDSRVLPFMPGRITNAAGGVDLFTNAWVTDDGEQLFVGAGARPLMIPTAIDTYGCIDSDIT